MEKPAKVGTDKPADARSAGRDYAALSRETAERAGVSVAPANDRPLDELMAWREEVLRDVFELAPDDDLSEVMAANRRHYEQALATGDLVTCFAWPTGGEDAGAEPAATGALCLQRALPSPDNPSGLCGYLMNVYTRPAWRHRGVGHAVVAWLCARALERGAGLVYLEATPAAMPLYRSLGFVPLEDYFKLG